MPPGPGPGGSGSPRGVLGVVEFRALAAAGLLSAVGDQVARVALSVLVFDRTSSALLTALTYALTFLPAVIGAPLLSGLADHQPRRELMVGLDLIRAALVAAMAVPGLPLPILLVLLVVVNVAESPFDGARAALVPDITGDRYLAAVVVDRTLHQFAQVLGFAGSGLLLLVFSPTSALLADAVSFAGSAILIRRWIGHRPAAVPDAQAGGGWAARGRRGLADGAVGIGAIWSDPRVRRAVVLTWVVATFAIIPEGLAAPYAHQLTGGAALVALLLAANPVGNVLGGIAAARWSRHHPDRLVAPLAQLVVVPLAVCGLDPPRAVALTLIAVSGLGVAVELFARSVFVAHVPPAVRGRAFGVAGAGLIVGQGLAVAAAGVAASAVAPSTVIGGAGILGAATVTVLLATTRPAPPD